MKMHLTEWRPSVLLGWATHPSLHMQRAAANATGTGEARFGTQTACGIIADRDRVTADHDAVGCKACTATRERCEAIEWLETDVAYLARRLAFYRVGPWPSWHREFMAGKVREALLYSASQIIRLRTGTANQ